MVLLLPLSLLWSAIPHADPRREAHADSLYHRGLGRWAEATLDSRRLALVDLEEAALNAPRREDLWLALGKCHIECGHFARGRACLTHAARLAPGDFDAWMQLGAAWKHDWLASLERSSLDEASTCYAKACQAAPERFEGWSAAAVMALLHGRPQEARMHALRAHQLAPGEAEPVRVLGAAFFRLGQLALADSAFRVAAELEQPATDGAPTFEWSGTDPDLTTPENEAELDYFTRLSLAQFLFRDGDRMHWDERAELFVRYGPPASIEYDPAAAQLDEAELEFRYTRHTYLRWVPPPIPFPYNLQVWRYPELGIEVPLWDRSLTQSFQLAYSNEAEMDPRVNPAMLAARGDLTALDGGKGVFRAMPPGAQPMEIEAAASRFPVANGYRLLGHLFAPGEPADSVWSAWALVRDDGTVVRRETGVMSPSACDPATRQMADFAVDLPPGDYRLDLSARASRDRRGIAHLRVHIDSLPPQLSMSDLVLLCGDEASAVGPEGVRIEPNLAGDVGRVNALTAYYELERLATDAHGQARFAYTYSVRSLARIRHGHHEPALEAMREESNVGAHRRQFVRVPIGSLAPGAYELRVEVRDLLAGVTADATLQFTKGRTP
jgi:Flp pilus assembly protein TadD